MPGLQACGRRWNIASDDFLIPGIVEAVFRAVALAIYTGICLAHGDVLTSGCLDYRSHIIVYGTVTVVLYTSSFLLALALGIFSCRGAIMETAKRRPVVPLIYVHILTLITELLFNIIAAVYFFQKREDIEQSCPKVYTIFVLVFSGSWIMLFFIIVALLFIIDPAGEDGNSWKSRCKCLCFTKRHQKENLNNAAELLSEIFSDVDLVPSDVMAAFTLLYRENVGHRDTVVKTSIPPADRKDWMTPAQAHHYMNFAAAACGWPIYVLMKGPCGCFGVCGCCPCCSSSPVEAVSDSCHMNRKAACKLAGINPEDLLHIDMSNDYGDLPYIVALDHRNGAVVIGIRGTMSVADILVDFQAHSTQVEVDADLPANSIAHKGVYDSAMRLRDRLARNKTLEKAFLQHPEYTLVCCGHSLGAGCAALLSILLRPHYPTLRCFALAPPGGLVSESLSLYCRDFIFSIVLNSDVVPFLGVHNVHELKNDIQRVLNRTSLSKHQIFSNSGTSNFSACCASTVEEDNRSRTGLIDEDFQARDYDTISYNGGDPPSHHAPLVPPGIICRVLTKKEHRWVLWPAATELGKIVITKGFLGDHMPQRYIHVLNTTPAVAAVQTAAPVSIEVI